LQSAGVSCVQYLGKEDQERDFINKKVQVLVANPIVGGVGKDYSNADIIVYYDLPLSATLLRQSVERTTIIGLKNPRLIISIVSTPIEETVARLVSTKLKAIKDVDILTEILMDHKQY